MKRKIIKINTDRCDGCGICVNACHEGAIELIDGKAVLTREDYCDGLGDCLPACPQGAISFEIREAPAYDAEAVKASLSEKSSNCNNACPGSAEKVLRIHSDNVIGENQDLMFSKLNQWPVQIKLAPVAASFFDRCNLLIAADCTAYAYANFHNQFMDGRVTLIGCPKLDSIDYSEKLSHIIKNNNIKRITVVRMEVPCCRGLEFAVKRAIELSGKNIPYKIEIISTNGGIV